MPPTPGRGSGPWRKRRPESNGSTREWRPLRKHWKIPTSIRRPTAQRARSRLAPNSMRRDASWMRRSHAGREWQRENEERPKAGRRAGRHVRTVAPALSSVEFSDEADFGLELKAELLPHGALGNRDELTHVLRRCVAKVHHDVRVYPGDLCIAVAEALEPALVHEPARTHTFDLLENRARAGVPLEPR